MFTSDNVERVWP